MAGPALAQHPQPQHPQPQHPQPWHPQPRNPQPRNSKRLHSESRNSTSPCSRRPIQWSRSSRCPFRHRRGDAPGDVPPQQPVAPDSAVPPQPLLLARSYRSAAVWSATLTISRPRAVTARTHPRCVASPAPGVSRSCQASLPKPRYVSRPGGSVALARELAVPREDSGHPLFNWWTGAVHLSGAASRHDICLVRGPAAAIARPVASL